MVNKTLVPDAAQQLLQPYTFTFSRHSTMKDFVVVDFISVVFLVTSLFCKREVWYVSVPLLPGNVKAICCSN